jgi:hypothetical protein
MPLFYYTCGTHQSEDIHCVRSDKTFLPLKSSTEYRNICFFKIDTKDLERQVTRHDSVIILLQGLSKYDTLDLYNLCASVKTT